MKNSIALVFRPVVVLLISLLTSWEASRAATLSWSGGGGADTNWSNTANWGFAGVPASGDTLIFIGGQPGLLNFNDIGGLILNQIRFVGVSGGYDLRGTNLVVTNSIVATNTAGVNIIRINTLLATNDLLLNVESGASLTLAGNLSGTVGVRKTGAGTATYSSTVNTYTGTTRVLGGLLVLAVGNLNAAFAGPLEISDGSAPATVRLALDREIPDGGSVTISNQGVLDLNNLNETIGNLTIAGGTAASGTAVLALNGDVRVADSIDPSNISGNLRFNGGMRVFSISPNTDFYAINITASISDSGGGLMFSNNTTVGNFTRLLASNSFTGPVIVYKVTVSAENNFALGSSGSGTLVTNDGELFLYFATITNESLALGPGTTLTGQGNCTWRGPINLTGDATIKSFNTGAHFILDGVISGTGNVVSASSGFGTNRFAGTADNTYSGTTIATNGALVLNKSAFFNVAVPSNLVINAGALVRLATDEQTSQNADVLIQAGGLFDFGVFYTYMDTLRGAGTVNFGTNGWTYIGLNNGSSVFDGNFTGVGYAPGWTVAKTGTGTFTMNGNSTYTAGHTRVNAEFPNGTLIINGSQPNIPVRVDNQTALGGSGTVGSVLSAGRIAPGSSPGLLTSSNVGFATSGSLSVELTGPTPGLHYDQLNVRGTNVITNVTLTVFAGFTTPVGIGQQFTIINNDGADPILGTFAGLPQGSLITSGLYPFTISYTGGTGNDVVLTLTNVPGATAGTAVSAGNGNHLVEPSECNYLKVVITNKTGSTMTGITATLSSADPRVVVSQPFSAYPDVPGNGQGTNTGFFQISTLPSFGCGSNVNLNLGVVTATHGAFSVPVTLTTGVAASFSNRYDLNVVTNIPDIGAIESTNTVAGFSGPIKKVAVSLWITHPFGADLSISLIAPDGTTVDLSSGNGSGADFGTGSADGDRTIFDDATPTSITAGASPFVGTFKPEGSLASMLNSPGNGDWRLRIVDSFGGTAGALRAWSLLLTPTACPDGGGACQFCPGTIVLNTSGNVTNSTRLQTPRLFRDALPSDCLAPKVSCPGTTGAGTRRFDAYTITNGNAAACFSVNLFTPCGGTLFSAAYIGQYVTNDLCQNYVADAGSSGFAASTPYSFVAPPGAVVTVVVHEVNTSSTCGDYTLQVTASQCDQAALNITSLPSNRVLVDWPTFAAGYQLEANHGLTNGTWLNVIDEPIVNAGRFSVTNNISPTNRFYRLRRP